MKESLTLPVGGETLECLVVRETHQVNLVRQFDGSLDDAFGRGTKPQKKFAAMRCDQGDRRCLELVEDALLAGWT